MENIYVEYEQTQIMNNYITLNENTGDHHEI